MIVRNQDIRFCLDKAAEIAEQYRLYVHDGENVRRSTDDLLWICEQYLNLTIRRWQLEMVAETSSIRGFYLSFSDHYEIYILAGMNYCWRRFVFTKELFQVLLDLEEYRTMYVYQHLQGVVASFPVVDSKPGLATVSEQMAEIAAMEFLFPYRERAAAKVQAGPGGIDFRAIAETYKVPQYYVERYLSDTWMQHLSAFIPAANRR